MDRGFLTRSSHGSTWGREYQNKCLFWTGLGRVMSLSGAGLARHRYSTDACWEMGDASLPQPRLHGHWHSHHKRVLGDLSEGNGGLWSKVPDTDDAAVLQQHQTRTRQVTEQKARVCSGTALGPWALGGGIGQPRVHPVISEDVRRSPLQTIQAGGRIYRRVTVWSKSITG